ncbi:MAG: hypothetical protein ACM3VT_04665 [Solirubrobacterales bacterium]
MKRTNHLILTAVAAAVLATSWMASPLQAVIPPDPDNAALLYYQAFISLADLDKQGRDHIGEVARGTVVANDKTRQYVEDCKAAIDFADAARTLEKCDWGFRYSQGFEGRMPHLAQMRFLAHVLLADARVRALDGDYKGALDRCLQMRTFKRHIGDETLISFLVGVAVEKLGYERMNDIIGLVAKDAETLRWLQNELAVPEARTLSPVAPLKIEKEIAEGLLQMSQRDRLLRALQGPEFQDMAKFYASADEATMARARRLYSEYLTSALAILSAGEPYEQAHRKLANLVMTVDANDPALAIGRFLTPALGSILSAKTGAEASGNATKTGVAVCLQYAEQGRLPQALPGGLPKDPFSGQDFQYEKKGSGFILRCRGKDLTKDKTYEYPFTLK